MGPYGVLAIDESQVDQRIYMDPKGGESQFEEN